VTHRQRRFAAGRSEATVRTPVRSALAFLTAFGALAGAALVGAAPASAVESGTALAPGVTYKQFDVQGAKGVAHAHLLTVDLRDKHVRLGLLYPGEMGTAVARLLVGGGLLPPRPVR